MQSDLPHSTSQSNVLEINTTQRLYTKASCKPPCITTDSNTKLKHTVRAKQQGDCILITRQTLDISLQVVVSISLLWFHIIEFCYVSLVPLPELSFLGEGFYVQVRWLSNTMFSRTGHELSVFIYAGVEAAFTGSPEPSSLTLSNHPLLKSTTSA